MLFYFLVRFYLFLFLVFCFSLFYLQQKPMLKTWANNELRNFMGPAGLSRMQMEQLRGKAALVACHKLCDAQSRNVTKCGGGGGATPFHPLRMAIGISANWPASGPNQSADKRRWCEMAALPRRDSSQTTKMNYEPWRFYGL